MAKIYLVLLFIVVKIISTFSLAERGLVSCTFDTDNCGWHSETSKKFRWKRGSVQTEDRTSGPLNDHTCANYQGEYIFIAGEDAESRKDIAVLESEHFTLESETSLTFWYIMNGFGTGALSLSVVYDNTTNEVWKKLGRQDKDWVRHKLTLKPGKIKLQFKATVRIPVGSDIAVDDIQLSSESQSKDVNKFHCETTTSTTSTTTTTTPTTTTTTLPTTTTALRMNKTHKASSLTTISSSNPSFSSSCLKVAGKTDILPGTCDFENDTCGIKIIANISNKYVKWERTNKMDGNNYQTENIYGDHTHLSANTTKGFYIAFRNAFSFFNSKLISSLETPAIYATYACLSFWYNVPTESSNLKVSIRDYTGRLTTMWSIDNEKPDMKVPNRTGWHKESISLFQDPPFTVVFQANNNNHNAKVGIDDIKIIGVNKNTKKTTTVSEQTTPFEYDTSTTTTVTSGGQTIPANKVTETTTPVISTGEQSTSMTASSTSASNLTPTTTEQFETRTVEASTQTKPQDKMSYTVSSTTPKPSTVSPFVSHSTEKKGKKTTPSVTSKKPSKIDTVKGDSDKRTEEEKYEKTSTIVGSAVGSVFALILVAVVLYFIVHGTNKAKRRRRQVMKNKTDSHGQLNGGVSNAGFTSGECLSTSNEKHSSNGHAGHTYENTIIYSLSQTNTPSHGNTQGHIVNGDLNGHASPIFDEERFTRL